MRCNACGRELKDGQMFCQCGATVGYAGNDSLNLYPEKKKGALPLIIGMIAGALIFIILIAVVISGATKGKRSITDRTSWERVSGPGFSITIPAGMKDDDVLIKASGVNELKEVRNSEVAIAVSSIPYDSKQLGSINRKKFEEMLKNYMPAVDNNGHEINLQERGSMFYYEYSHQQNGVFFGVDTVHVVDAMCVGKNAVYDVTVICPEKKYAEYSSYIFAWIDSFQGE